jgi:hypothetical protein
MSPFLMLQLSTATTDDVDDNDARESKSHSYPKHLSVGITYTIDDEV